MNHILENIYCGDENDAKRLGDSKDWVILHCCKFPYHRNMVGYSYKISPTHPNYSHIINKNNDRMALNLVDMDEFQINYLNFNFNMFTAAFIFLDKAPNTKKILIHCNRGESRSPSITMLFLRHKGIYQGYTFEEAYKDFHQKYPALNPRKNIIKTVERLWDKF